MYRKRDWTQDWDGASGRPKAVSPLELENEIETAPGIDPGAAERSLPGAAAEARAPSPTPPSPRRRRRRRCPQHPARIPAMTPAQISRGD